MQKKGKAETEFPVKKNSVTYNAVLVLMIALNMALGCASQVIVNWINMGLAMFG